MSNNRKIEFFDLLLITIKNRLLLAAVFFLSLFTAYGVIYFFVEEEYQGQAIIIPSNDETGMEGLTSLANKFSNIIPFGFSGIKKESLLELFNTLIYSRTSIEKVMDKFELQARYKIDSREKAIKAVKKMIETEITLENAFTIKARADSPELAAEITNYLIDYLNEKVVELNIVKARDNRLFIEKRYRDIRNGLRKAEDSLEAYQEQMNIFEAESQAKASIENYAQLESELAAKNTEFRVLKKLWGDNSDQVRSIRIGIEELKKNLTQFKKSSQNNSVLVAIDSMPSAVIGYYRHYRNVEIYNKMLTFILPVYEQAKYEEQKMMPVLNVIDYAVPPETKVYPHRTLLSGIIAIFLTLSLLVIIITHTIIKTTDNPKIAIILQELFKTKSS